MKTRNDVRRWALAALLAASAGLAACGKVALKPTAVAPAPPPTDGRKTTHHTSDADGSIVLRDAAGNPIARGAVTPYSPEQTCGRSCHDVGLITRGYHFQQGRTNAANQLQVSDGFNPAKPWLLSNGMYGKT